MRVRGAHKRTKASDVFFENRINLITIEELANYIGVSSKTVQNWVAPRSIPFLRIGRKTLFRRERIDSWLQTKEFEANRLSPFEETRQFANNSSQFPLIPALP